MNDNWRDTYDQWKLATPPEYEDPDEVPRPEGDEPELIQCDCCDRMVPFDRLHHLWAFGIETYACPVCCGDDEDDEP